VFQGRPSAHVAVLTTIARAALVIAMAVGVWISAIEVAGALDLA
jgi:hypothetical protein